MFCAESRAMPPVFRRIQNRRFASEMWNVHVYIASSAGARCAMLGGGGVGEHEASAVTGGGGIGEPEGRAVPGGGMEEQAPAVSGGGGTDELDASAVVGGGGMAEHEASAVTGGGI